MGAKANAVGIEHHNLFRNCVTCHLFLEGELSEEGKE